MGRYRRTYGSGIQLSTDDVLDIPTEYSYSVANYTDLETGMPDEIIVYVENSAGTVKNGYYIYDSATIKWSLIYGSITSLVDAPATPTLYSAANATVEIILNSQLKVSSDGRAIICSSVGAPTLWTEQTPGVSVSEYTSLPINPPQNYKILCTNDSLAGLGPLSSVILQHSSSNDWTVAKAAITGPTGLPTSPTIFSDATYTILATSGSIFYDPGRAWNYNGSTIQEYEPDPTVADFSSLPISASSNHVSFVTANGIYTSSYVASLGSANDWRLIRAEIPAFSDLPAAGYTDIFDNGTITITLDDDSQLFTSTGRAFKNGPTDWTEFRPGDSTNWGTFVNQAVFPVLPYIRSGDLAYSTADLAQFIYSGGNWLYYLIDWDGSSAGETYADLPSVNIYTGAIAIVGIRAFKYTGVAWDEKYPETSVQYYSELSSSLPVDYFTLVTGESVSNAVVKHISGSWELFYGTVASSGSIPIEPVYNVSGTIVNAKQNALLLDTSSSFAYFFSGSSWVQAKPNGFVDCTTYANTSSLDASYSASLYSGSYGISTYTDSKPRIYESNGSTWEILGSDTITPTYTVSTFSELPATATEGQRVVVTGESGLSSVICVATLTSSIWNLERAAGAFSALPTMGTSADTWYSVSGTVVTSLDGCWFYDTTYSRTLRWWPANTLGTDGVWIPPYIYGASSKTLNAWLVGTETTSSLATQGWTVVRTTGGTSYVDVSSDGTRIVCTAISNNSAANLMAALQCSDASLSSAANVWAAGLVDLNTPNVPGDHTGQIALVLKDGADDFNWGTSVESNATRCTGMWFNPAYPYSPYGEQIAGNLTVNTESLIEFEKRSGYAEVRRSGSFSRWNAISTTTTPATVSKFWYWPQVSIPVSNPTTGSATVAQTVIVRYS